jgi:diguanylate cyclase (GGDEF)-like protein/PAS domain S-box-containing protein
LAKSERRALAWRAVVNPGQLATLPVIPAMLIARDHGVTADVPAWLIVVSLLGIQIGTSVATIVLPPHGPTWQVAARTSLMVLLIGAFIYVTGWGAALTVGFVFGAAENIRVEGARAALPAMAASVVACVVGETAIALGWLPSLIPEPEGHGVAALGTLGAVVLIGLLGVTTRARDDAEAGLRNSEVRFRALVQHASDAVVVIDAGFDVMYASPALESLLGIPPGEFVRFGPDDVHPDDLEIARAIGEATVSNDAGVARFELRLRHRDGTWRWFEVGVTNRLGDPAVQGLVCNMREISERKAFQERLEHQARHDELTALPNRAEFAAAVERQLATARTASRSLAVLFLDLDRFKLVNDSLGHDVGDSLLVAVAERIKSCLREGDLVGRFGGDEFTVLLPSIDGPETAIHVAERLIRAIRAPLMVAGRDVVASASIGIALSRRGVESAAELLKRADLAMYVAKDRGRSRWELFNAQHAPEIAERFELEGDLWRGLERGELEVHFQPERDLQTDRITGAEALVRWRHPARGLLLPESFVPLAEESGLIIAVDRAVLRAACTWSRRWARDRADGERPVVSVNVSPQSVRQDEFVDDVLDALRETEADPRRLQIEITERTALSELEGAVVKLEQLRALGVRVAIDDFGTGYSALGYLKRLPVDVLKLDRSFVDEMDTSDGSLAIVEAVITMAHALGLDVTAEGIERPEQAQRLAALGCKRGSGWLWSRAVPPEELTEMLAAELPSEHVDARVVPFRRRDVS